MVAVVQPDAALSCAPVRKRASTQRNQVKPSYDEYVSDPAKPVPYRARPIDGTSWSRWLVDDQREASGRPDVAVFISDMLTAPVKISGEPIVNLIASTSGTDSDWVVKVIDLYPDEVAGQPNMGGYQLMISADILRGRYRESLSRRQTDRCQRAAALSLCVADSEPRLSAGPPDHGAGAIELVPALRSQPANICAEYFLGEAGRLPEGYAADLSHGRRS